MSRFLFTTLPTDDLGLPTRALPIAEELRRRGHEVLFSSPAPAPSRLLADAGFENLRPPHAIFDLIATGRGGAGLAGFLRRREYRRRGQAWWSFLGELLPAIPWRAAPHSETWNADHAAAQMGLLNEGFVRAGVAALRGLMRERGIELLVDFWNPLAVIAARSLGVPVVAVVQANAHPQSSGFLWWRTPPDDLPTAVPVVNRVMAELGLAPVSKVADLGLGDRTLVVGLPETDPLPGSVDVEYVGALLWQSRLAKLPPEIERGRDPRPLVWVYSGNPRYASSGALLDSAVVLRAGVEALADGDWQVVLTTGHHALPRDLLPLPPGFFHAPYLPGLAMAERADVLVHHGGYGSCQTGLYAGRPQVIVPTFGEREGNARRIAALGAGLIVPIERRGRAKRVSHVALREAVARAHVDVSFSRNAERLGRRLRAWDGAARAANAIEDCARRAPPGDVARVV